MNKIKNNKGFTVIEILFSVSFLAIIMAVTQATLSNIIVANRMIEERQAEVIAYTSMFETYVMGILETSDIPADATVDNISNVSCYGTFSYLTTDNRFAPNNTKFYYKDLELSDSESPHKDYTMNIHAFVKNTYYFDSPYYFVLSD